MRRFKILHQGSPGAGQGHPALPGDRLGFGKRVFDHTPHEVFVQLDELCGEGEDREWKETARWIKYEEHVEEGADRWGRPHVASLSFHSLLNLRRCLETGGLGCRRQSVCRPLVYGVGPQGWFRAAMTNPRRTLCRRGHAGLRGARPARRGLPRRGADGHLRADPAQGQGDRDARAAVAASPRQRARTLPLRHEEGLRQLHESAGEVPPRCLCLSEWRVCVCVRARGVKRCFLRRVISRNCVSCPDKIMMLHCVCILCLIKYFNSVEDKFDFVALFYVIMNCSDVSVLHQPGLWVNVSSLDFYLFPVFPP